MPVYPSYWHICKRINKLNIDIKIDKTAYDDDDDDDLAIAIDSTIIKVTNNRGLGGYMRNGMFLIGKARSKYILW